MKLSTVAILFIIVSCKHKNKDTCTWRSVDQLQQLDLTKCPKANQPGNDSIYFRLRHFSGEYNTERKNNGIPVLPGNFEAELYSVNNQAKWHGDIKDGEFLTIGKPYLKWKSLEWNKDTLKYDISLFVEGDKDRYGPSLSVTYYLDTLGDRTNYLIDYIYSPGIDSRHILMSKVQADSVLKTWKTGQ